jgi:hypothetical protein
MYTGGKYPVIDGTILKKRRLNPIGQHVYLNPDGSVERDEDKIIAAQRIFLHHAYKPNGRMYQVKKKTSVWTKDGTGSGTDC